MTYDASNRKDIRRAEKLARQAEIARVDYLKAAMSTWQGRAWFHDLLTFCNCFIEAPSWNPYQDYHQQGMCNVGLRILADLTAQCPDDYILMMKEDNARRIERDIANARASGERSGDPGLGWDDQGSDADPGLTEDSGALQ